MRYLARVLGGIVPMSFVRPLSTLFGLDKVNLDDRMVSRKSH